VPNVHAKRRDGAVRARSNDHRTTGSSAADQPSRCPLLCTSRYGAMAKATPPSNAASTGSRSSRSQANVATPASTIVESNSTFQATTGPNAASSGQNGSPHGQADRLTSGGVSGRKL
jgi:hypothetical protein